MTPARIIAFLRETVRQMTVSLLILIAAYLWACVTFTAAALSSTPFVGDMTALGMLSIALLYSAASLAVKIADRKGKAHAQ